LGCNFKCLHCQNWTISQQQDRGRELTPERIARMIDNARREGCRNQNWVGGDPIPHIPFWLRVLLQEEESTPVFFNTNGYYSPEAADLLRGIVDICKIDFKYGSNRCAEAISDAPGYWEAITRNITACKHEAELLVRILVLPGHLECCLSPILGFIAERLGKETRINLMNQYAPHWRAGEVPCLNRRLTPREWGSAKRMAEEAGLENVIT
jgi:putative pyruvate formate lyase activating enzyme